MGEEILLGVRDIQSLVDSVVPDPCENSPCHSLQAVRLQLVNIVKGSLCPDPRKAFASAGSN
jgi:hypothetical protein